MPDAAPPDEGTGRGRRPPALVAWVLASAGLTLALAGAVAWNGPRDAPSEDSAGTVPVVPASVAATVPTQVPAQVPTPTVRARVPLRPGTPHRLVVPALDVDARVVPVAAPDRTLVPPDDADVLGWWADGVKPGGRHGSALVAGHTLSSGSGALQDLEDLRQGDRIEVRTSAATLDYTVTSTRIYSKGRIREDAEELFDQRVVPSRLVLVTCEDWDGTAYRSNVVVVAVRSVSPTRE